MHFSLTPSSESAFLVSNIPNVYLRGTLLAEVCGCGGGWMGAMALVPGDCADLWWGKRGMWYPLWSGQLRSLHKGIFNFPAVVFCCPITLSWDLDAAIVDTFLCPQSHLKNERCSLSLHFLQTKPFPGSPYLWRPPLWVAQHGSLSIPLGINHAAQLKGRVTQTTESEFSLPFSIR